MKSFNRVLICIGLVVLLVVSWILVVSKKSDAQLQAELIQEAKILMEDKVYVRAEPLLEQASGYDEIGKKEAETLLKEVYINLSKETGYAQKMEELIEKQLKRKDPDIAVYTEASEYYLSKGRMTKAIDALRQGVENTGSEELKAQYEAIRYSYTYSGYEYEEVTAFYNDKIQVQLQGLWGLANNNGEVMIPCEYEKISTFSNEAAIVKKENEIYAINSDNLRIYLLHEAATDFTNYGNDLWSLKTDAGWVRADGSMHVGSSAFEAIGMYSEGYAAAQKDGKWGIIDMDAQWVVDPIYDEVVMNELGQCWYQGAAFVRQGSEYYLVKGGKVQGTAYEDVRVFNKNGWAAVKSGGVWTFIDAEGQTRLECGYENVQSFSEHLAAVEIDGKWGYISKTGELVIDAEFENVKCFYEGVAPVYTDSSWQFIVLDEYKED